MLVPLNQILVQIMNKNNNNNKLIRKMKKITIFRLNNNNNNNKKKLKKNNRYKMGNILKDIFRQLNIILDHLYKILFILLRN